MNLAQAMIEELTHEALATRKALARVPLEEQIAWQPHTKSMSLGVLASHIADINEWGSMIINGDKFVMNMEEYVPHVYTGIQEMLDGFDAKTAKLVEDLRGATGEHLAQTWSFYGGDTLIFSMPRAAVLRSMVFNHAIHHRGQLTVYLRLLNIPVPGTYGPSADETD